jgi:2-dehydro-3-deoxyphosphogluconate aldolase/(4S)-4-hydroxy-2-oxoglutarate aldolase
VAILRLDEPSVVRPVAEALLAGGITALEVTMTVPRAVETIEQLALEMGSTCLLGAGTVLDAATARRVASAGAQFVVSPTFEPEVITEAHAAGVVCVPGCFSPTEVWRATCAGADLVKLFPAGTLGPGYVKDMRAPLPDLKLMATGGVTLTNAAEWIAAGCVAVGIGSALVDRQTVRDRRFERLTERARTLISAIRTAAPYE